MPVRQGAGDVELGAGADQGVALQRRLDRGDRGLGQHRQVGQGFLAHLGALAEGAAQIHRLVIAAFALLIHMRPLNSDYMRLTGASRHALHRNRHHTETPVTTRQYSAYIPGGCKPIPSGHTTIQPQRPPQLRSRSPAVESENSDAPPACRAVRFTVNGALSSDTVGPWPFPRSTTSRSPCVTSR